MSLKGTSSQITRQRGGISVIFLENVARIQGWPDNKGSYRVKQMQVYLQKLRLF